MTMDNSTPPKPECRWYHFRLPMLLLCLLLIVVPFGWWYGIRFCQAREQARREGRIAVITQLQHTALAERAVISLLFYDYLEDLPEADLAKRADWSIANTAFLFPDSPDALPDSETTWKECHVSKTFSHPSRDLTALSSYLQSELDEQTGHSHDNSFPAVSIVGTTLSFRWPLQEKSSTQP